MLSNPMILMMSISILNPAEQGHSRLQKRVKETRFCQR